MVQFSQIGAGNPELAESIGRLKSDDPREQRAALDTLASLGERAAPALPAILDLLEDDRDEIRCAAIATLGQLGSLGDDALIAANASIRFRNISIRQAWHAAIAARGPDSPTVDLLVEDLNGGSTIRESATARLQELGPAVFEAILRVGARLLEEHSSLRSEIFEFLHEMPDAEERLLAAARDRGRDEGHRAFAVQALGPHGAETTFGADREGLILHLLELAADEANRVVREAASCLGHFGERAAIAVPALMLLLHRSDDSIFPKVIDALARLGPAAAAALEIVRPLGDADTPAGHAARTFVRKFADSVELAETIRQGLRAPDPEDRIAFWRWLGAAADLFPDLPDLLAAGLADPAAEVRRVAARELILPRWRYALCRWPSGIDPVPLLRLLMNDADPEVRWLALSDLSFNRHLIPAQLPKLLAILAHDSAADVRRRVLYVFGPSAGDSKPDPTLQTDEVLAAVRCTLRDGDKDVQSAALNVLRFLWNPLPAEVVPDLVELARADQGNSSSWALSELAQREDCPAEVLDLLRERLPRYLAERPFETFLALTMLKYTPSAEERPLIVEGVNRAREYELHYAADLLGRMGADVVPSLLPLLADDRSRELRTCVITALQTIGSDARAALPDLVRIAVNPDRWEACDAVKAIAAIAEPAQVIEYLRPCFRHRQGTVRTAVLEIANEFGPAARPWLEELIHLTRTDGKTEAILIKLVRNEPGLLGRIGELLDEPEPARSTARNVIGC